MRLIELKDKLSNLNYNEGMKLLYMWIKQNHISLTEFKELIKWFTN